VIVAAAAAVAAAASLPAPARAGAITYGIGDAHGHFASCPSNDDPCSSPTGLDGYWRSGALTALKASPRPLGGVRMSVKYDAVTAPNGAGGCTVSNPMRYAYVDQGGRRHPAGQSWHDLLYGLQAAYADGLTPLIVIVGYTAADAVKSYAGTSAPGDPGEPDPTSTAGYWDYYCGVQGILDAIAAHLPAYEWPHQWEAWNEPDGGCAYLNNDCSTSACALAHEAPTNYDPDDQSYTCSAGAYCVWVKQALSSCAGDPHATQ
jgi:hypothetical protein